MIKISDKTNCCGCNACGDVCPKGSITFKTDLEGFWYPEVNMDTCIDCHLCEKVCPIINIKDLKKNDYPQPAHTIAAINRNMRVRWNSTSGGAYSALAETMLEEGGYVSGAIYNEGFTGVHNYVTNNPEDLEKLRSSKYLQSNAEGLFKQIKELLINGEKVLACATPCQMAALRSFLRKDYDNLVIVDLICRGVNSPKVYRAYLDSLEKKYGSKVVNVKAKNKELGWRNLTRKVTFENGQSYYGVLMDDDFRRGYHTNVFCRPSCYDCKFKQFPRIADITLADYWGIEKVDKNLDNNIGTSLILLNSRKGTSFFEQCSAKLEYKETDFQSVVSGNQALFHSIKPSILDRKTFFEDLNTYGFDYIVQKYFPRDGHTTERWPLLKLKKILVRLFVLGKITIANTLYYTRNPKTLWYNYWINHRNNTIRNNGKKIIIKPSVTLDIHKTARIEINESLTFGNDSIRGLRIPSGLRMEEGTVLTINGGPLTRYGNAPYNMRYGAYIEVVNGGHLTIGQGGANVGLTIMCAKEVVIGNDVRIGRDVSIRDWNGPHVIVNDSYVNHAPVHIEDHVWITSGCTIMPGVTIGRGSVVAANSTVTKDVPPYTMVGGSPAKVLRENIEWY